MAQIKNIFYNFFRSSLFRFLIIGVINTILGVSLMFLFYNYTFLGYWGSSALSYVLASIFSFFANKIFTFKSSAATLQSAVKFSLNIGICYVIAYLIAKPAVFFILSQLNITVSKSFAEQAAMIAGMFIFTALNYIGQRFFIFKNKEKESEA